jgi:nitrite reductase/ring-hydroxylating ferredoxin subunit
VSTASAVRAALAQHRGGHALPQAFALSPAIHAHELDTIWRASWLFGGPSAQVRLPGDFFRLDMVAGDSVIIVRGEDGELHGLHNTCRHRGMPICPQPSGHARRWVCPYHQWSYGLDGRLLGCSGEQADVDRDAYGLHRAAVAEVGGLVFVWFGPDPAAIDDCARDLAPALAAQGLDRARVAHVIDYEVRANWKLRHRHAARAYRPELLVPRQRRPCRPDASAPSGTGADFDPADVAGRRVRATRPRLRSGSPAAILEADQRAGLGPVREQPRGRAQSSVYPGSVLPPTRVQRDVVRRLVPRAEAEPRSTPAEKRSSPDARGGRRPVRLSRPRPNSDWATSRSSTSRACSARLKYVRQVNVL